MFICSRVGGVIDGVDGVDGVELTEKVASFERGLGA